MMKSVSIVVPVKNEEKSIQLLIDSIANQTVLPAEVILADGGSSDRTREIIKRNIGKLPFNMKLVELEKAYPGEGRNAGIAKAGCDLIAFTDGGIALDEKWLEELVRPMELDGTIDVVYGAYKPVVDSFIKECSVMAYVPIRKKIGDKTFRTNFIASSLFKKKICEEAGLFPPFRAAEDRIFMDNVKRIGAKIAYTDKAVVRWQIPGSLGAIFGRFCEFSMHDIAAGRAKDWHYSVSRTYAVIIFLSFLGIFINRIFFVAIPALLALRVFRMLYKRREDFRLKYALDPRYLVTIIAIIFLTDIAMFCGSLRYLLRCYETGK
jgi:glycosyltransferase involved in cell wall biosynthesis